VDLLRATIDVDRALVKKGTLYDFARMAWPVVEPAPFVPNWHFDQVGVHLQAVSMCQILRLIINIPPGTGKSSFVNVFWPVWEWIHRPATKWIYTSYDSSLVGTRDGGKVIKLLSSDWFKARWGDLLGKGKPAASKFDNVHGGFRFATSTGGAVLGRHGDIQVCDDPVKPKDAAGGATMSRQTLRTVSEWWKNTMASRMATPATGRRVIVMQRLCHDDLAGEMLATNSYVHLRLPQRYEVDWPCKTLWGGDQRTVNGELLFPERFPKHLVDNLEAVEMGEAVFAAQEQQRPQVSGGGVFKRDWFRFFHVRDDVPEPCRCEQCFTAERCFEGPDHPSPRLCVPFPEGGFDCQSWDMAFDKTDTSDFVAGGVVRVVGSRQYLIDFKNERMSFVDMVGAVETMTHRHPRAHDKLIERTANGPAVINFLRDTIQGLTPIDVKGSKEARANVASTYFKNGQFYLPHPELAPWVWIVMKQLEAFPKGSFDDIVDMISQVVVHLKLHGNRFQEAMSALREGKR
jgi:predicted phage terminase large subunit-like protein